MACQLAVRRISTIGWESSQRTKRWLAFVIRHRIATVVSGGAVLAIALWSLTVIGTEFMPKLDEGSILVETRKLPGISLSDSVQISRVIEQKLRSFPEISDVVVKIGRPDFATEAMGINEGDTYLLLKPIGQPTSVGRPPVEQGGSKFDDGVRQLGSE